MHEVQLNPSRRALAVALSLLCLPGSSIAQNRVEPITSRIFATSVFDPRLADLRKASATWEFRSGPVRKCVNLVCLVPDFPTFLDAIATWDETHYFPILLEDAKFTLKFLRAFQPAKVVRFPARAEPIPDEQLWDSALSAVGRSWVDEGDAEPPPGDAVPALSRPTPPGVVFSVPGSSSLAGAIALAAGRFQPLLRWDIKKGTRDLLTTPEAEALANELIRKVSAVVPSFDELGDACDFVTLAGPWPYRYDLQFAEAGELGQRIGFKIEGTAVLDDLLGRGDVMRRWAFVGRLVGDDRESLYRAMCSLFLQPESAVLFDTYDQGKPPWTEYEMVTAAERLGGSGVTVQHVEGTDRANAAGWHQAFDPLNRARLVLINSSGGPRDFRLTGARKGVPDDIPPSDPTAVLMIHSFSASNPFDPETVAGRWLSNGAFLYFGSVNEPTLAAFRPPTLVADLIAEYLPLSAAVRQLGGEPFGFPWRLIFLGDPLYRLRPPERRLERVPTWGPIDGWPAYTVPDLPQGEAATEGAKLAWSLRKALLDAASRQSQDSGSLLTRAVIAIQRDRLDEAHRKLFDAILADTLIPASDRGPMRRAYSNQSAESIPDEVDRLLRTTLVADLHHALDAGAELAAGSLWVELMSSKATEQLKLDMTRITGSKFETQGQIREWQRRVEAALRSDPGSSVLRAELDRLRNVTQTPGRR